MWQWVIDSVSLGVHCWLLDGRWCHFQKRKKNTKKGDICQRAAVESSECDWIGFDTEEEVRVNWIWCHFWVHVSCHCQLLLKTDNDACIFSTDSESSITAGGEAIWQRYVDNDCVFYSSEVINSALNPWSIKLNVWFPLHSHCHEFNDLVATSTLALANSNNKLTSWQWNRLSR